MIGAQVGVLWTVHWGTRIVTLANKIHFVLTSARDFTYMAWNDSVHYSENVTRHCIVERRTQRSYQLLP